MTGRGIKMPGMNILREHRRFYLGEVEYAPGGTCGPRRQGNVQLVAVRRGEARVQVDDAEIRIGPGEAAVFEPGRREWFRFARRVATEHVWCEAVGVEPGRLAAVARPSRPVVLPWTPLAEDLLRAGLALQRAAGFGSEPVAHVARALLAYHLPRAGWHELAVSVEAGEGADAGAGAAGGPPPAPRPPPVARALERIRAGFAEDWTLAGLAAEAGVTPQHLTRLFRRHVGSTPMAHLWDLRVRQGVELLRSTGLGVEEVAVRCGFASAFHFSRRVRRREGRSPRALRRIWWEGGGTADG